MPRGGGLGLRGQAGRHAPAAPAPQDVAVPSRRGAGGVVMTSPDLVALEIRLLLEGIYEHYGYDFRNYAASFMHRRVVDFVRRERLATISGLQEKILHDPACVARFSEGLSVSTTSMFRDPAFFTALRRDVVPLLRT